MNQITYAVHEEGYVVSRLDEDLAWPILDFGALGAGGKDKDVNTGEEGKEYVEGDFNGPTRYDLGRVPLHTVYGSNWRSLTWTKKIPLEVKNYHRAFWGRRPVKESSWSKPMSKSS